MMHQPLFVQTSAGTLNLALVRYAYVDTKVMRFVFDNEHNTILPVKEVQRIIRALVSERPDLFLVA